MLRRRFLTMLSFFSISPVLAKSESGPSPLSYKKFLSREFPLSNGGNVLLMVNTVADVYEGKPPTLTNEEVTMSFSVPINPPLPKGRHTFKGESLFTAEGEVENIKVDSFSLKNFQYRGDDEIVQFDFLWPSVKSGRRLSNSETQLGIRASFVFIDEAGLPISERDNIKTLYTSYLSFDNQSLGNRKQVIFYQTKGKDKYMSSTTYTNFQPFSLVDVFNCRRITYHLVSEHHTKARATIRPKDIMQPLRQLNEMSAQNLRDIAAGKGEENTPRCAITTAVCGVMGLNDDCFELAQLRSFRDRYVSNEDNIEYRQLSTKILAGTIFTCGNAKRHAARLYLRYILPGAMLAWLKMDKLCYRLYKKMVLKLSSAS